MQLQLKTYKIQAKTHQLRTRVTLLILPEKLSQSLTVFPSTRREISVATNTTQNIVFGLAVLKMMLKMSIKLLKVNFYNTHSTKIEKLLVNNGMRKDSQNGGLQGTLYGPRSNRVHNRVR